MHSKGTQGSAEAPHALGSLPNNSMSTFITPVTDVQQLEQYAKLGRTQFERGLKESAYKINENVQTESKKEDPTNRNTTTQKVIDWGIYNIKGQSVQGNHIGVNIDKLA